MPRPAPATARRSARRRTRRVARRAIGDGSGVGIMARDVTGGRTATMSATTAIAANTTSAIPSKSTSRSGETPTVSARSPITVRREGADSHASWPRWLSPGASSATATTAGIAVAPAPPRPRATSAACPPEQEQRGEPDAHQRQHVQRHGRGCRDGVADPGPPAAGRCGDLDGEHRERDEQHGQRVLSRERRRGERRFVDRERDARSGRGERTPPRAGRAAPRPRCSPRPR